MTLRVKDIRLCIDEDGNEAVYVDGKQEMIARTIYGFQIADISSRCLVKLKRVDVVLGDDTEWPVTFAELMKLQRKRK